MIANAGAPCGVQEVPPFACAYFFLYFLFLFVFPPVGGPTHGRMGGAPQLTTPHKLQETSATGRGSGDLSRRLILFFRARPPRAKRPCFCGDIVFLAARMRRGFHVRARSETDRRQRTTRSAYTVSAPRNRSQDDEMSSGWKRCPCLQSGPSRGRTDNRNWEDRRIHSATRVFSRDILRAVPCGRFENPSAAACRFRRVELDQIRRATPQPVVLVWR